MAKTALVVGASGIVGSATAALLVEKGWTVHGLARRPTGQVGVEPVAADLQDRDATATALREVNPDAVFITTWARQDSEAENIRVNAAMVRNLLDGLPRPSGPRHVALVTGLKHYLGPFEAYGKGTLPQHRSARNRGGWTSRISTMRRRRGVRRREARRLHLERAPSPHGHRLAVGNAMNMGTTMASMRPCAARRGRPFTFPGSAAQWSGLTDMTDCRAACPPSPMGDRDRGGAMTRRSTSSTATSFAGNGCGAVSPTGSGSRRCRSTASFGPWTADGGRCALWREIAAREGLAEADLGRLASPWHTRCRSRRPIEVVTDMSKSRRLGFTVISRPTTRSFRCSSGCVPTALIP